MERLGTAGSRQPGHLSLARGKIHFSSVILAAALLALVVHVLNSRSLPSVASKVIASSQHVGDSAAKVLGQGLREKRSDRFPSKEKRLQLYMGHWFGPAQSCGRRHSFSFINATTLVTEEQSGQKRPLTLSSAIRMNRIFWVDPTVLRAFADAPDSDIQSGDDVVLKQNSVDAIDLITPKGPVLLVFGDGVGSIGLGPIGAPTFRRVRRSLPVESYGECPDSKEHKESIIWNLNKRRHFSLIGQVKESETAWHEKQNVAFFRGALTSSERGTIKPSDDDYEKCMKLSRCRLVYNYDGSELVDAKLTGSVRDINSSINGVQLLGGKASMEEQLQYKALVMLEGNDVSSGLKWALFSDSVVFMQPPKFTTWAMEELLEPYVHYVPLDANLSNVDEQVRWVMANDAQARRIAQRATDWISDMVLGDEAAADDAWIRSEMVRLYGDLFVEGEVPNSLAS